jgi:hypothetical protein
MGSGFIERPRTTRFKFNDDVSLHQFKFKGINGSNLTALCSLLNFPARAATFPTSRLVLHIRAFGAVIMSDKPNFICGLTPQRIGSISKSLKAQVDTMTDANLI